MKVCSNPWDNGVCVQTYHSGEINTGITWGFCISCFLLGGLTCQKGGKSRERMRIGKKKRLTQGHSHGTLRKEVPLIPSKPEKSAINLCCSLPPPVAIVALVVDHFGNIWSWALFGGQIVSTRRSPTTWPKKITLVSCAFAVTLLVRSENAGFLWISQAKIHEPMTSKQL